MLSVAFAVADSLCMLCVKGVEGIKWHFHKVDPTGTTCIQKAITMASDYVPASRGCQAQIAAYREMCCGDSKPDEVVQIPTGPPSYSGPTGDYSKCDICYNGDYPGNTAMVITMLYIGTGSCKQFYDAGQAGLIQDYMCQSLQYFAYEPCGCGEFHTKEVPLYPTINYGPPVLTPAPTEASKLSPEGLPDLESSVPNTATTDESQTPTGSSTQKPTSKPTQRPSSHPTLKPTANPTRPIDFATSKPKKKNMGGKRALKG